MDIDNDDIKTIEKNKIAGSAFIDLTYNELADENGKFKLTYGSTIAISKLVSELNTQTKKNSFGKYTLRDLVILIL